MKIPIGRLIVTTAAGWGLGWGYWTIVSYVEGIRQLQAVMVSISRHQNHSLP
ncbi:hypothetical protein BO79DRAFT_206383 [Aspergillus costaricaensis CBS 115574]|uniref:Uncharacterized protein n=1 Tax=Aspergillus costaricaensis CBS 115574 TaxID=1448317 RepID=A0ACD1ISP3_9EURO|nr:hypothetical protein BO79DRAFT_206383 [Aspergillus costaricaensis CBS 115574]RAK93349.1 hypothetical protein BO79DRAFT_206383 [Aspergillus costaricaensis CBS 115574]